MNNMNKRKPLTEDVMTREECREHIGEMPVDHIFYYWEESDRRKDARIAELTDENRNLKDRIAEKYWNGMEAQLLKSGKQTHGGGKTEVAPPSVDEIESIKHRLDAIEKAGNIHMVIEIPK